jgi:hypothetical protein
MFLDQLHMELDPNITQIEVAGITALSLIIVALVGIFSARRYTHPREVPENDPDEGTTHVSALASYSGDQNEFIALVIKDSKDLHERMDTMSKQITVLQQERTAVVGAFGRYVMKLALAWGSGGKMPYPDDDDMALLEETLPVDWRRRRP